MGDKHNTAIESRFVRGDTEAPPMREVRERTEKSGAGIRCRLRQPSRVEACVEHELLNPLMHLVHLFSRISSVHQGTRL